MSIPDPPQGKGYGTPVEPETRPRYFFRVTGADLRSEASRDPHVAAQNLIQMTLVADAGRPRDVCYVDAGRTCFDSLSMTRALDTLTGLIVGYRLAGSNAT